MARKVSKHKKIRYGLKNSLFQDRILSYMVNRLMSDGLKETAEKILLLCLASIKRQTLPAARNALDIVYAAVQNVRPFVIVKSVRVAGATYMVPKPITERKSLSLAINWIVLAARRKQQNRNPIHERLANEILLAAGGKGDAIMQRDRIHTLAKQNQAFSHFR